MLGGVTDQLAAVLGGEGLEELAKFGLDGAGGEAQGAGDLLVGTALGESPQDLDLAQGNEFFLAAQVAVAGGLFLTKAREDLDHLKDVVGFAHQGAGAGSQGALLGQLAGEGRQCQNRHHRVALAQGMDDFQSGLIAQGNPHHQHVGELLFGQFEQSFTGIGLGHHLDSVLFEQLDHSCSKKIVFIRQ